MSENKKIIYMVLSAWALLLLDEPDTKVKHNREKEE